MVKNPLDLPQVLVVREVLGCIGVRVILHTIRLAS